jgi:hypothetical protein
MNGTVGRRRPKHDYLHGLTAGAYRGSRECCDEVNVRRDCWKRDPGSYYLPNRGRYSCGNGTALKPMPGQATYWEGAR